MISLLLAVAIHLTGVRGEGLRARAFFDANNVRVGDPLTLTIDFIGTADFKELHPPALTRHLDRGDWKLDDISAKTDTYRDARRLTYRVRPMREGVLWFPSFVFSYEDAEGREKIVRTNVIPVHARAGAQVEVAEMGEIDTGFPKPPELLSDPFAFGTLQGLSEDRLFAWRRACAKPSAEAFAAFDFPAARLNEATCAIRAGNWARALAIYRRLEWRIGQTAEIEEGILAALAQKDENQQAELPIWRTVLRPILRYAWLGRVSIVLGFVSSVAFLFWLIGRGIRAVACLGVAVLLVGPTCGQDIFQQFEQMHRQMRQQMNRAFGNGFGMTLNGEEVEPPQIGASVTITKKKIHVGESFDFILSLEMPKTCSVGQIRIDPSERFGLTITGAVKNLTDAASANPSNVVKRLSIPARYDVPLKTKLSFVVSGSATVRQKHGNRTGFFSSFSFSNDFRAETQAIDFAVEPLDAAGQPKDFSGIISEGLSIFEYPNLLSVETNDVVTIVYRMRPNGFVPPDFLPEGAAFEMSRQTDEEGRPREIEYHRYIVADGISQTPALAVSYYDPRTKTYRIAKAGGTPLKYGIIHNDESH